MKLKGIWITIFLILVAGIAATRYTKSYVEQQPAVFYTQMESADESSESEIESGFANQSPDEWIPPKRLVKLDEQQAKRRSETEMSKNSMKAAAESEWKQWEMELEHCLELLNQSLSKEDCRRLFDEQKEWLRQREQIALESSKKQRNSTLGELEYNRSLRESTRNRVYELAKTYPEIFQEAE